MIATYKWVALLFGLLLTQAALAQTDGFVSVFSKPEGCWVRIDSVLVGKTPLQEFKLSAEEHFIQVFPPQKGVWNLQERRFTVTVKPRQLSTLNAVFDNPVFINSIPYGARLFSDTTRLGDTPLYLPFEENRGKLFRLEKKGYKPYEFALLSNSSLILTLEKRDDYVDEQPPPELLGVIPKRHFKSKFTLLAVSVAAHWASFYFKNVADDSYDKYRASSDPRQTERFWDKTQKYDRLSDISLGVSFASLAGLVYMVIWK